jgi:hypothetical protein
MDCDQPTQKLFDRIRDGFLNLNHHKLFITIGLGHNRGGCI